MKKLIDRWKNDPIWRLRWERIALWLFSENEEIDTVEDMEYTPDGYLDLRGFPLHSFVDIQDWEISKIKNLKKLIFHMLILADDLC